MSENINSSDRDIAKELVIHLIDRGYTITRVDATHKPEAIGEDIATLYNTILRNISK